MEEEEVTEEVIWASTVAVCRRVSSLSHPNEEVEEIISS